MACPGSFWKCSYGLSWFLLEMLLWLVLVPFGNVLMNCLVLIVLGYIEIVLIQILSGLLCS
jgi:hypothetical protein